MQGRVEIGGSEKHTIEYEYSEWSGIEVITIDGVVKHKGFSIVGINRVLEVGEKEKHQVKIRYGFLDFMKNKAKVTLDGKESEDKQISDQRSPLGILSQTQTGRVPFVHLFTKITNKKEAETAVISGVIVGVISIFVTAVLVILPFWGVKTLNGLDASVFADITIMILLVLGLAAKSRISACLLCLYFILSKIALTAANPQMAASSWVVAIFFVLIFLSAAKGAFAYWRYSEKKPKRFSWRILLGIFVALLAMAFFQGHDPNVSEEAVNESWWQSLDQEFLTAGPREGNTTSIIQSIGKPDRWVQDGGLFVRAAIQPAPMKVGKESTLTYTLFTRFDTRYEGVEEQPDFGPIQHKTLPLVKKEVERKTQRVMGKRYISAELRHVVLTPKTAGRQELKLGALGISVDPHAEGADKPSKGREWVPVKMPPVVVDVKEG